MVDLPFLKLASYSPIMFSVFGSNLRYIMLVSTLLYTTKQFLCGSHKSVYRPSYGWDKLYISSVPHYLLLLPNKGY